jgi:hypothetical protein
MYKIKNNGLVLQMVTFICPVHCNRHCYVSQPSLASQQLHQACVIRDNAQFSDEEIEAQPVILAI